MASLNRQPSTSVSATEPLVNPAALGRGLAVLRIFVTKVTGERVVEIGWYLGVLISRDEARNILDFEVNQRNRTGMAVPYLKDVVNDFILPTSELGTVAVGGDLH